MTALSNVPGVKTGESVVLNTGAYASIMRKQKDRVEVIYPSGFNEWVKVSDINGWHYMPRDWQLVPDDVDPRMSRVVKPTSAIMPVMCPECGRVFSETDMLMGCCGICEQRHAFESQVYQQNLERQQASGLRVGDRVRSGVENAYRYGTITGWQVDNPAYALVVDTLGERGTIHVGELSRVEMVIVVRGFWSNVEIENREYIGMVATQSELDEYKALLKAKQLVVEPSGKSIDDSAINPVLFPFQRDIVRWAVYKGRCAIFADTGLGKTGMQVEWARLIGGKGLIIAPLTVARQTVNEAQKLLGVQVHYTRSMDDLIDGINITNYEMIEHFDASAFEWVVLDESSILKSLTGKTRNLLIKKFQQTPYRLCATATPAPNDITELANHSEFLGIMPRSEMLSVFFTYADASGTSKDSWRLKKHAVNDFYRWLASWGMAIKRPSDLGYDDTGYNLPALSTEIMTVETDYTPDGMLPGFFAGGISAIDARAIRRTTTEQRAQRVADMVNSSPDQWVLWTGLNNEADQLTDLINDAVNVEGSMSPDAKADALQRFVSGDIRVLVTKPSIAGFGINMQNCHNMVFVGLDYSWETYYQAVRRVYRFGQSHPVKVHIIISEQERIIFDRVIDKEVEATRMTDELIKASRVYSMEELHGHYHNEWKYQTAESTGDGWKMLLGDSVERLKELADESADISIYSPPFNDIFVYSATPRDLGNSPDVNQFFQHYGYIIRENYRVQKPGRLCCVHIQDGRAFKSMDGFIGRKDLSGMVIEAYQKEGWVFWQRITIDKNPQAQAIRLKDHGLLFKTLTKDSTGLAGGHADYLLIFKKPGDNAIPVQPLVNGEMTADDWIQWAHPCWYDIRESDVLNVEVARSNEDEKHMCPLQLPLITRCLKLWSNPGELVLSPFAGIGSEGYEAVRNKRRFIGIELKPEYYRVAGQNLRNAELLTGGTLFQWAETQRQQTEYELMIEAGVPDTEEI